MERDLGSVDPWEESLRRSRERRERAAAAQGFDLPTRGISVAAVAAVTAGPVAGIAVGKALGGGGGEGTATAAKPPATASATVVSADSPAAHVPAKPRPEKKQEPAEGAAKPKPKPKVVASVKTPAPEPVTRTVATSSSSTQTRPAVAKKPGGVKALQSAVGVPVDGDFGKKTERALKRWQKRNGLTADGVAGPATRQALGIGDGKTLKRERPAKRKQARKPKRKVRAASPKKGGGVAALQRALGLSADGVFGPATEKALKRWQRSKGLAADGVAGPQTRRALGIGDGPVLKRKRSTRRRSGGGGSSTGDSAVVQRVIAAANRIATTPYRYGGGHGSFTDSGYDCSGSVSYALHGGGLLSSPLDSSAFMSYGKPGPGKHITIYANPGHVFMTINGRRFDTSARSQTGSRWGGPRSGAGYTVRHPAGL